MGYFKELEIDVVEMYREDGMSELEIAKSLGISLTHVHEVLAKFEHGDHDYDIQDGDVVSYDELDFEPSEEE
jgi:transposase